MDKKYLAAGFAFLVLVAVLWFSVAREQNRSNDQTEDAGDISNGSIGAQERPSRDDDAWVLGDSNCFVAASNDLSDGDAVIITETASGARIHWVSADLPGTEIADVDFFPNTVHLGTGSDDQVLIGVGDIRLNSKTRRDASSPEPVRIFLDEAEIYTSLKALRFGISGDASSFYVVEPMGSGMARLIVRNLEHGTEHHVDLGSSAVADSDEAPVTVAYSTAGDELIVHDASSSPGAGITFISTVSGERSRFAPDGAVDSMTTLYESSRTAYLVKRVGDGLYEFSRVSRMQSGRDQSQQEWSTTLALDNFYGTMTLSDDGDWVLINASEIVVLRAGDGSLVFRWPSADETDSIRERLSSVVEDDSDAESFAAGIQSVRIQDGELRIYRKKGLEAFAECHLTSDPAQCIEAARAQVEEVVDVFNMSRIEIDSMPDYRSEISDPFGCEHLELRQ